MVPVDEQHANLEPIEDQVMLLMAPVEGREGGSEREREGERE